MKHVFLSFLILVTFSCKDRKQERHYYFVGYNASSGSNSSIGNCFLRGTDFTFMAMTDSIYEWWICKDKFTKDDLVITGIYEFKDSFDYAKNMYGHAKPSDKCESSLLQFGTGNVYIGYDTFMNHKSGNSEIGIGR